MNNSIRFVLTGVIILAALLIIDGCKKKSDDPVVPVIPTFNITYSIVPLQAGGDGLQFFAKCTNNGVTMEKVSITTPASAVIIYDCKGKSFVENELFPIQDTDAAYLKETGNWKFNFVGTADGVAFAIDGTISVSK